MDIAVITCPEQRNDFFPCAIRLDAILPVPHIRFASFWV